MMRVALIDDEQFGIDMLEILMESTEGVEVIGKFTNPKKAIIELNTLEVDVVFLDMEMGEIHGLAFAEELLLKFPKLEIVFVSAHPQFALKAFEVNAIDYLLKPVKIERLQKTIYKLQKKLHVFEINKNNVTQKNGQLYARTMGKFQLLDLKGKEIKWRTRKGKELFIYLWHQRGNANSRTKIMEDIWGDIPEEKATTLMHTTVYQLRKKLKEIGINNPISLVNETYILNLDIKSDLDVLLHRMMDEEVTQEKLKEIIELYQGEYLEEESYSWVSYDQQQVKNSFLQYLERYYHAVKGNKEHSRSVEMCLQKLLLLEPYNEQFVYMLLEHYGLENKTEKMISLYHEFKEKWVEDLGIDVPKEIVHLYREYLIK